MKLAKSLRIAALFTAITLAGPATAHEFTLGDLSIGHPMAFATPITARTGAGYLSITNNGETADRLIEVKGDFPRVQIHTNEMNDGVASMIHVDGIDIAPGETITMAPGGYHIMFMGLKGKPFEVGQKIPATLVFEKAGSVDVVFNVEDRTEAGKAMDHSGHGMEMDHDKEH